MKNIKKILAKKSMLLALATAATLSVVSVSASAQPALKREVNVKNNTNGCVRVYHNTSRPYQDIKPWGTFQFMGDPYKQYMASVFPYNTCAGNASRNSWYTVNPQEPGPWVINK